MSIGLDSATDLTGRPVWALLLGLLLTLGTSSAEAQD